MSERMPIAEIAGRFAAGFPESRDSVRTLGREAEFPVVNDAGEAADVRALWAPLAASPGPALRPKYDGEMVVSLECEDYTYSLEVGWGTVEIITGPRRDLQALRAVHEVALSRLYRVAEALDFRILGYGTQPLTPPSAALMSPKERYGVLYEVLGDPWYWFTVTASDQVHVDIDRRELVAQINLVNLLAPVVIGLCANSSVQAGELSGFMSSREARMGEIHAGHGRHGMPLGPFADLEDFIGRLSDQPFLVHNDTGSYRPMSGLFSEWLLDCEDPDARWKGYLMHEHYIWNSGRPRPRIGTIELRSACQQPHASHMAGAALGLGLVEAAPQIAGLLDRTLGEHAWPAMRAWHKAVVREGLAAEEPAPGLLAGILERARDAVAARGFGEASLLAPLEARLEARKNPAQLAAEAFEQGGVALLVEQTAL
jgi:gamma-glutamylcysteine synthetase